jgi:hypothetical protein
VRCFLARTRVATVRVNVAVSIIADNSGDA